MYNNIHHDVSITISMTKTEKLPLIDRPPTPNEIEQLRLILSTYQDGSGMLNRQRETEPATLPGWRDFERATALALDGLAIESKWVYDVVLRAKNRPWYGIDCKMRSLLADVQRKGVVSIEVSNAASDFWNSAELYFPELWAKTLE